MLISGYSGVGKSVLVKEIYKFITRQRGYFISGKFEKLQQNTPYTALIQAFQALIQQLLTESKMQIVTWRETLLGALGTNGQVMIDVIPGVELIIGKQLAVPELPPAESRNRFNLVFQNFIQVFTQREHPLVIFLDDLQWSDRASLKLIQQWVTVPNHQYLLFIGAYREGEINSEHPLRIMLEKIQKLGTTISHLTLSPLKLTDISQLIADAFQCDLTKAQPLAELVNQKTNGNPFFIREFLTSLYEAKLIHFDVQRSIWQWDLQEIQATHLTDNFIELTVDKIQHLSASTQQTLKLAACMGHQFDSRTLAMIRQISQVEIVKELWNAVQAGLISPVGDDYKYLQTHSQIDSNGLPDGLMVSYRFLHDHIQQAVYSLISEVDQKRIHLQIGQSLLKTTPAEQQEDQIFGIVNQLNLGAELITEQDQKDKLARLNLIAGNKAKASIAYDSALDYLNTGRKLLGTACWHRAYELTLSLYGSATEAAYLSGDFEQMEQLITKVSQQAKTTLDQLQVYQVKIQASIAQNRFSEAIATALHILQQLGFKLPPQPSRLDLVLGAIKTKLALANKPIQALSHLPRMTAPDQLAAMQVIASVCTPTYFIEPQLWQMMVFQKVQLSLKYGNAPGSAFGYADYGMVLCGVERNFDAGYQFAQLATTLLPQLHTKEFTPKTLLLINIYLKHWREHLRATLAPLFEAYQAGLETGDLEYATFSIAFHSYHSYLLGRELNQLEREMAIYGEAIAQFKQAIPLYVNQIYRQAILNLLGKSEDPCRLVGDSYNEDAEIPIHQVNNDQYALFQIHLNKLLLCYLFQNDSQAVTEATVTEQLLSAGATGMLVVPIFYFYSALAQLAVFPHAANAEKTQILSKVTDYQKTMKEWADHAPMNYLHKYYLVEAERHRVLRQTTQAMDAYDRAITLAKEYEYLNEEALANELAAKFYLENDKTRIAQVYLLDARYCYWRWGAIAKVKDLETRYPQLLESGSERTKITLKDAQISTVSSTTSSTETSALDLAAVMRAAQALSGEIVLDRLLAKLMKILIENAGAEKGCLILEIAGKFLIEVQGFTNQDHDSHQDQVTVLQPIPIESQDAVNHVSVAIVNYVIRTCESLVLSDATQDSRFTSDRHIANHQPKSVLCAPLINQGKLTGIIYLENNLTTDAFSTDRLEVIQLLSTQAAISIDNARLYDELEIRVQQRTTELTQANQQLEQLTTELQRSNQELEQFAYIASHDLQEPLRAITSYTQKLAQRYQGKLDEKADLYIGFAVDGATRMQQLIQDLLAYSRVGRQKLKLVPTDCNAIAKKVLRDLQVAIVETQAQITLDPLPIIHADPTQISLLFQNLISNAIKYHSELIPQIQINAVSYASTWLFSIHDNGIGIESQYVERIFGIFQRLHSSDEYSGTGLGLAISKKIVENHGGRIWVESQPGQGSTFWFEIPILNEAIPNLNKEST
jgi:histidine kinase